MNAFYHAIIQRLPLGTHFILPIAVGLKIGNENKYELCGNHFCTAHTSVFAPYRTVRISLLYSGITLLNAKHYPGYFIYKVVALLVLSIVIQFLQNELHHIDGLACFISAKPFPDYTLHANSKTTGCLNRRSRTAVSFKEH